MANKVVLEVVVTARTITITRIWGNGEPEIARIYAKSPKRFAWLSRVYSFWGGLGLITGKIMPYGTVVTVDHARWINARWVAVYERPTKGAVA